MLSRAPVPAGGGATLSSHIKGRVSTDRSTSWLTFPKRGRESKTHDSQVQWCEDLQSQQLGRLRKEDDGAQEFKTSLGKKEKCSYIFIIICNNK